MTSFSSHAKWILSGEHSVVRGGKAIAFPLCNYTNSLTFEKGDDLSIFSSHEHLKETVFSLLEIASSFSNIPLEEIRGRIAVESDIPIKAGLGSSAAICANIVNLFKYLGFCGDALELAKRLENKFHQKSSGLDVTVALENKPVVFHKNRGVEFLKPKFWPCMILTYSGEKSPTSDCISIVREIFLKDEKLALELDEQMNLASELCEHALKNAVFSKLKDGITLGNKVFRGWGLCNDSMSFHMEELLSAGAVAAKPTGSGLGGYVLSLWEKDPPQNANLPPHVRL